MNVLVITRGSWSIKNNTGNTLENFFSLLPEFNFYNLALKDGECQSSVCKRFFVISESLMCRHPFSPQIGSEVSGNHEKDIPDSTNDISLYSKANANYSSVSLKIIREIIWKVGKWKNKALEEYLAEIRPDVIYMPAFNCWYPYDVLKFVRKKTNAKVILFHADDNLSIPKNCSFINRIYRIILQNKIIKASDYASANIAISELMARDYAAVLNKPFTVISKSTSISDMLSDTNPDSSGPGFSNYLYTGNIGDGRFDTLVLLGRALDRIENSKLSIYTANTLTNAQKDIISEIPSMQVFEPVSNERVRELQREADFLVFAESFDEYYAQNVRYSFSTKITDYLSSGRCIIALGNENVNSIQYFINNEAALVITKSSNIYDELKGFISDRQKMDNAVKNALHCAKEKHDPEVIKKKLEAVFLHIQKDD